MKHGDRDKAYLWDMLDSAKKIFNIVNGKTKTQALEDEMFFFAVERLIEIIGEAANRVSKEFQQKYAEVPWSEIISMRNHLIHEYSEVDLDEVWDTVTNDIPLLIKQLDRSSGEANRWERRGYEVGFRFRDA